MSASAATRDRLAPWIDALQARSDALSADNRPAMNAVIAHLRALHRRDIDALWETISDDIVIRVAGWTPGGSWTFSGDRARLAYGTWLAAAGDALVTNCVDIDRFFPGEGVVGFDGDHSHIASPAAMSPEMLAALDPEYDRVALGDAEGFLVVRRVACFATVVDSRIAAIDLYWSVHPAVHVSDAARAR